MTVGSYSMDNWTYHGFSGSFVGTKGSKSWNGADRPKVVREKPAVQTILREIWDRKQRRYVLRTVRLYRARYFPKRVKGKDPHPYQMEYLRRNYELTYSRAFSNWVPDGWYHESGPIGVTWEKPVWEDADVSIPNQQIKLVGRLTDQLSGSDFNMSVFLGELPQTLNLLADSAIRIRKSITQLRRGNLLEASRLLFEGTGRKPHKGHDWRFPSGKSLPQSTARNWLELQYGWLPLLKDAEGAAQSIAHALYWPLTKTYRANVKVIKEIDSPRAVFGDTGWVYSSAKIHKLWRRSIVAYITEDRNASLPAALGLLDPEDRKSVV